MLINSFCILVKIARLMFAMPEYWLCWHACSKENRGLQQVAIIKDDQIYRVLQLLHVTFSAP